LLKEVIPFPIQGLFKFSSVSSVRLYLKELMSEYEREADRYGEKVGSLMRILDREAIGRNLSKLRDLEWRRVGMVVVNDKDPIRGTLELLIEAMEDCKVKATRTAQALTSVNELERIGIPDSASILVYLRHGVPLRIVIDNKRNPEVDVLLYTTFITPSHGEKVSVLNRPS